MTTSPTSRLIEAANELIAEGLQQIGQDDPGKHKALIEYAAAGAIPRLLIESLPGLVVVSLTVTGADGESIRAFEYRVKRVNPLRH